MSKGQKEIYHQRQRDGICTKCGAVPAVFPYVTCDACREKMRIFRLTYKYKFRYNYNYKKRKTETTVETN